MMLPERFRNLPPEKQEQVKRLLDERARVQKQNPVLFFKPHKCKQCGERYENPKCKDHRIGQHEFLESKTYLTAALAGNQFGKTTVGSVRCFIQHCPPDLLPRHLKPYRAITHEEPVVGWAVSPSARVLETVTIPALQHWAPMDLLHGGSWGKAFEKQNQVLRFKDGGRMHLFSYEMKPDKFVGAQVDYVWFDEPPPEDIFNEASVRVIRRGGKLNLTLTPVNMQGGGIGYLYRRIWKQREDPEITVVRGSIHDNPHLPTSEVERFLQAHKDDPDLAAREYGDFVHIGGMVYSNGFERVLTQRDPTPEDVKHWDVVVGMDPGLKNAAFIWVGFDSENRAFVFDEVLLQEKTPKDYARAIRQTNAKWGIRDPMYVIDPSARNRSLVNAESVEAVLQHEGIYPTHGMNAVEAGVQQIRTRMGHKMLYVSPRNVGLRSEAEEYRMQDTPDGEFKVVKENDHRLDAMRYAVTTRLWDPLQDDPSEQVLGWQPGKALSGAEIAQGIANFPVEHSPLGVMS